MGDSVRAHGCVHRSELTRLYLSNMHHVLLVNYASIKLLKLDPWGWIRDKSRIQIRRCLEIYSIFRF